MLVFLKKRVVLLATPKCGSTALEAAFGKAAEIVISGHPRAKHTAFRRYERFLKQYCEECAESPLEVVCLVREPLDWLGSWWRYRQRPALEGKANSTQGMDFDAFVQDYLKGAAGPAKVGRQAQFVSAKDGSIGPDRIWRYDNLPDCAAWLSNRLGVEATMDRLNVSTCEAPLELTHATRAQAEQDLARDYEIYHQIAV